MTTHGGPTSPLGGSRGRQTTGPPLTRPGPPEPTGLSSLDDLAGRLLELREWAGNPSYTRIARRVADALDALLAAHAGEVCAVLCEPLVQCAAGMRMHHPRYLARLREICDRHRVHWICLLYTSPSPRDGLLSRMPSSA